MGHCVCTKAWRGPTCAAFNLAPTTRENGFQHKNSSSWGGSIMHEQKTGTYHMFSSFILGNCGLDMWSTNSEIVRATAAHPTGPYTMQEAVAPRFAHEPNLVFNPQSPDQVMLIGSMYPIPPPGALTNCTAADLISRGGSGGGSGRTSVNLHHKATPTPQTSPQPPQPPHPPRNSYLWVANSPSEISQVPRQLAVDAFQWDYDPSSARHAICDTNLAGAVGRSGEMVGLWRRCEGDHLHTVPHTLTASDPSKVSTYAPNVSVNLPFVAHAGAEDPMVYHTNQSYGDDSTLVYHAVLHDEQITRCLNLPACFDSPGVRFRMRWIGFDHSVHRCSK
jgi:hypothetical protein